jgi:hypothetical protein
MRLSIDKPTLNWNTVLGEHELDDAYLFFQQTAAAHWTSRSTAPTHQRLVNIPVAPIRALAGPKRTIASTICMAARR